MSMVVVDSGTAIIDIGSGSVVVVDYAGGREEREERRLNIEGIGSTGSIG